MPVHSKRIILFLLVILIIFGLLVIPASWASARGQPDNALSRIEMIDGSSNTTGMKSEGFSIATLVIAGMVASLLFVGTTYVRGISTLPRIFNAGWLQYALPVLCVIGLGVAGYLSYVEIFVVEAVCGPVGDCNAVQSSIYAKLFGVLPIGVLGMAGYVAILAAWLYPRIRRDRLAHYAPLANFCMTIFGVIFSVYLTYLEIFVIRAVCMWCVTSAIIMTLLLLVTLGPALQAMDDEAQA
ncbi:MAG: vitamin K epoxide reductase family protein [Anaerolineales bacterium]|nr:vitamin K epoxide reductase family protein [Anaerolineales bacterium]